MKKELSYLVWNAFQALSLLAAYGFGIRFPITVIGVIAGIELTVWFLALFCMGDIGFRKAIRKVMPFKWWRIITESGMVAVAAYCGCKQIACAWVMIAALAFYLSIAAMARKEEDEKKEAEKDASK